MTEPSLIYLDSSALMRLAQGVAPSPRPRDALIRPYVLGLLGDPNREVACSELSLLEWHSNITTSWRSSHLPDCDENWWSAVRIEVQEFVSGGKLMVLPIPVKAAEHVLALVTVGTRDHQVGVKAWDAMHAMIASRWAFDRDTGVEIVTSDDDFDRLLTIPGMAQRLTVTNLDRACGTGEGGDR